MSREDRMIRTGFGVLTESAPPAPSFEEITAQAKRRSLWRPSYAVGVVGLAALMFVSTLLSDGGMRLAYAMDPGLDLKYTVNSKSTLGDDTFTAGPAAVRYQLSDAGGGLFDVYISYEPLEGCGPECPPGVTFTQTVTGQGEIVAIRGLTEDQGVPGFVIPVPIHAAGVPAARVIGGFPRFLGPPLPEHQLRLRDTWETNEHGVIGQHQIVDQTQLNGRDVVIIDSTYTYTHPHLYLGEVRATTSVWFDPTEGIVVQALVARNSQNSDGTNRTEQMDFKLDR